MKKIILILAILMACVVYAAEKPEDDTKCATEFMGGMLKNDPEVAFKYLQKVQQQHIVERAGSKEKAIKMLSKKSKIYFDEFKVADVKEMKMQVVHYKVRVPQKDDSVKWKDTYATFIFEDDKWSFVNMSDSPVIRF
ncbi:MAG: hypothetical protein ACYTFY_07055 [Planctomycetota bacterium]